MDKIAFFRHAAVYGAAGMLLQAAGLVLLPLYTRHLGPADFGVLEVLGRTGEVLATLLLVGGVRQAMVAFHQQAPSEADRRAVAATGLLHPPGRVLARRWTAAGVLRPDRRAAARGQPRC